MANLASRAGRSACPLGSRYLCLLAVCSLASLPFYALYATGRRAVMEEIRQHARGVAATAALGWDRELVEQLLADPAEDAEVYRRAQSMLAGLRSANPDVRYAYLMRRSRTPRAPASAFEYVVDAPPVDFNRNGRIDRDEASEAPGTPYSAASLPEMVRGWTQPTADKSLTPDPPYPEVLSGYSPIRDKEGRTRALLGVDITGRTVAVKLRALFLAALAAWAVISGLITLAIHFFLRERESLERVKSLNDELAERNELLHAAGHLMAREADSQARDRKLALTFQSGLVKAPARPAIRKVFDKPYLTALALGPALVEVFDLGADHVGFCHAQPGGGNKQGGLAAHLFRTALYALRERGGAVPGRATLPMTDPSQVLARLNEIMVRELPPGEMVSVVYGVLDISAETLRLACAAHASLLCFQAASRTAVPMPVTPGIALGVERDADFAATEHPARQGDRLLVHGDDAVDSPGVHASAWGEDRLCAAFAAHGGEPPELLAQSLAQALQAHGGEKASVEDASFLLLHLR